MTPASRDRWRIQAPILIASAAAWGVLALGASGIAAPAICSAARLWSAPSAASLDLMLAFNPPGALAAGWALMLAAMMAPLLAAPLGHLRDRSFARRRPRAMALFVLGYAAVWLAAGVLLVGLALTARLAAPTPAVPVALAAGAALVWQASPWKQIALNRCHARPELAAFGAAADTGALRFGAAHGLWCVGSCWALMLLPLLVPQGHLALMAVVAVWLAAERLERPAAPQWRCRIPVKGLRIALGRTRLARGATMRPPGDRGCARRA